MKKFVLIVLINLIVLIIPNFVHAQTSTPSSPVLGPIPTPHPSNKAKNFNCADSLDPMTSGETEFDSLRPYQASPCKPVVDQPSTLCGNTMLINDAITVAQGDAKSCDDTGTYTKKCHYEIARSFDIRVDPSRAELPIAGNTELTRNRYSAEATIDNATQVNDYLSWYLNGTIFRAEEINRFKKDPTTGIYDYSPFIDYAGPIRKLLPLVIQNQARATQVNNAVDKTRHDQAVACIYDINLFHFEFNILGFNIKNEGINLGGIPAPCPAATGNETLLQKLINIINPANLIPKRELKLSEWDGNLPPEQKPNESFQDFYKRYVTWRGKYCVSIRVPASLPFIGNVPLVGGMEVMYCFDDALNPNFWANEFPWIPFTSTEDKLGDLNFSQPVAPQGGEVTVIDPKFVNPVTSDNSPVKTNLYFPHMEENQQLSQMLSSSYLPKDLRGDTSLGKTVPISETEKANNCKILDIRSNPGDKLFGDVSPWGSYFYTADFDCEFTWHWETITDPITGQPIQLPIKIWEPSQCKKTASFTSTVNVDTPMIDSTWATLVAGNTSDFRRIFPKLGSAGLGDIKDMPAVSSNVIYTAQSTKNNGITSAGPNPAEIYFPHLGGISEYFLKAIQTLLRPKGFGEPIEWGNAPIAISSADCKSAIPQNVSGLITKEAFNTMAGSGSRALECFDYVVGRAIAEGIDPALALWVWLNESRASNYNWSVHDFGVISSQYDKDIVGQMGEFIRLKKLLRASAVPECAQYAVTDDLHAFAYLYFTGHCNPNYTPPGEKYSADEYYQFMVSGIAAMH